MKRLHIISAALMVALIGFRAPAEAQSPFGPPPQPAPTTAGLIQPQTGYGPVNGSTYGPAMTYGNGIKPGMMTPAYTAQPTAYPAASYPAATTYPATTAYPAAGYPATTYQTAGYTNPNPPLAGLRTAQAGPVYGQPSASYGYSNAAPAMNANPMATAPVPAVTENIVSAPFNPAPGCDAGPMMTGPAVGDGAYQDAMCGDWGAPIGAACGPCAACPRWFGGVYGLIMDRVDNDRKFFLMDPAVPSRLYGNSLDASMNTAGGVEARVGRTFCNCLWGLEFVYWGLFPSDQCAHTSVSDVPAATVYMTPDYRGVYLDMAGGVRNPIDTYFNNGTIQRFELRRSFEYNNVEINLLSGPLFAAPSCGGDCGGGGWGCGAGFGGGGLGMGGCGGGCGLGGLSYSGLGNPGCGLVRPCTNNCGQGPRWQAGWLFGVRYFKIDEAAMLAIDNGDGYIDYSYTGGNNEFFHEVQTENNLVGVQLGLNLNYFLTNCFQFDFGTKFGFYNNRVENYQRIFNQYGLGYVDPTNPQFVGLRSSNDDIAFLGEIRGGVGYRIGCHWRLTGGYRALAASNVANPLDQLAYGRTMGSIANLNHIHNDSSLILHGAYFGADFAW